MDTFSFTFSNQAQLATDLICDPSFTASDAQILELKQGLGLRTPGEDFWVPIGKATANMDMEDRISLLGYIVPRFGSGDAAQEKALQSFAAGLQPTYSVIRSKCSDLSAADVELLGTELLATEILTVGRSTNAEFAAWLGNMTSDELRSILSKRKAIRENAAAELEVYKKEEAVKAKELEEKRAEYQQQLADARKNRSMIFNPRTQKMEVYENPNKK